MSRGIIYGLVYDGKLHYIGQTNNIARRYGQHCSLAQNMGKNKRHTWLREIILKGEKPEIIIIEEAEDMDEAEIRWIKHYRDAGHELINTADGGKLIGHLHRAKKDRPWGRGHSPVQHCLMVLKQNVNSYKRYDPTGTFHATATKRYNKVVELIDLVGKERMNMLLWAKYGNTAFGNRGEKQETQVSNKEGATEPTYTSA